MGVGRGEKHLNIDIVLKLDIKKKWPRRTCEQLDCNERARNIDVLTLLQLPRKEGRR